VKALASGSSLQVVHQAGDMGWRAVLAVREPSALASIQARYGEQVMLVEMDVTKPDTIDSAVARAEKKFGRVMTS
jgi:NADP-dependent 3-hydroxy acid dehydrogenase YdfG